MIPSSGQKTLSRLLSRRTRDPRLISVSIGCSRARLRILYRLADPCTRELAGGRRGPLAELDLRNELRGYPHDVVTPDARHLWHDRKR